MPLPTSQCPLTTLTSSSALSDSPLMASHTEFTKSRSSSAQPPPLPGGSAPLFHMAKKNDTESLNGLPPPCF